MAMRAESFSVSTRRESSQKTLDSCRVQTIQLKTYPGWRVQVGRESTQVKEVDRMAYVLAKEVWAVYTRIVRATRGGR